jgi:hypothetical protein
MTLQEHTTTHPYVAIVHELDIASFPSEKDTGNDVEYYDRETQIVDKGNHRKVQSETIGSGDDGSTIDILCLYTRQALQSLCEGLNGKNCDRQYLDYKASMNLQCRMAVDQTVRHSVYHFIFEKYNYSASNHSNDFLSGKEYRIST